VSSTGSRSERRARVDARIDAAFAETERVMLRLEATAARRRFGIDTSVPGWRDDYLSCKREAAELEDSLIATPHVAPAIARMEEQFH
jgi:hypothetical protein